MERLPVVYGCVIHLWLISSPCCLQSTDTFHPLHSRAFSLALFGHRRVTREPPRRFHWVPVGSWPPNIPMECAVSVVMVCISCWWLVQFWSSSHGTTIDTSGWCWRAGRSSSNHGNTDCSPVLACVPQSKFLKCLDLRTYSDTVNVNTMFHELHERLKTPVWDCLVRTCNTYVNILLNCWHVSWIVCVIVAVEHCIVLSLPL